VSYEQPDDVEEILTTWITPVCTAAVRFTDLDQLPFVIVNNLGGDTDIYLGLSDPVVSVRVLCDKRLGHDAAARTADRVHRRLVQFGRELPEITLTDGRIASIDYLRCIESPHWAAYDATGRATAGNDEILCKLARYQVGLTDSIHHDDEHGSI